VLIEVVKWNKHAGHWENKMSSYIKTASDWSVGRVSLGHENYHVERGQEWKDLSDHCSSHK